MLVVLEASAASEPTSSEVDIPMRPLDAFSLPVTVSVPSWVGVYLIYLVLLPLDAPPRQYTPAVVILSWSLSPPLFAIAIVSPSYCRSSLSAAVGSYKRADSNICAVLLNRVCNIPALIARLGGVVKRLSASDFGVVYIQVVILQARNICCCLFNCFSTVKRIGLSYILEVVICTLTCSCAACAVAYPFRAVPVAVG